MPNPTWRKAPPAWACARLSAWPKPGSLKKQKQSQEGKSCSLLERWVPPLNKPAVDFSLHFPFSYFAPRLAVFVPSSTHYGHAAQDIRYGWQNAVKTPALTAVVAITLALGIGANTLIFSFVNGFLLRPMPVPHPEQIAVLAAQRKDSSQLLSASRIPISSISVNSRTHLPICSGTSSPFPA